MRRVSLEDVAGLRRYAEMRDEFRRKIIEVKRRRRISLGDKISLVFENFDTVLFQIQEMCHVERIADIDRVREEIEVYNELLPRENELAATLFIEITDPDRIGAELRSLIGIDECVRVRVNERTFPASFAPGRSTEERLSAVQYVRFPLDPDAVRAIQEPGASLALEIEHPNYRAHAALSDEQRASLAGDFA